MNNKNNHNKPRLWTGDFALTMLIALFAFIACQALNNGTPLYIVRVGGMTSFAGTLILLFCVSAAVARIVAGRVIDRTGRKKTMVVGALFMLAGTALGVVFPGMYAQILFRALQGIGFACVTTASSTAAADVLPAERLGEGIGYYALGQSLGVAVGPAFGIMLCSMIYAESIFVGTAAVCVVLLILIMCCTYEKHIDRLPKTSGYRILEERKEQLKREANMGDIEALEEEVTEQVKYHGLAIFFEKRAFVGAVPMIIICFAFAIPTTYTALYAHSLGFANAGLFFLFGAIAMTVTRILGGRLLDIVPPRILFLATTICGIIMFGMYFFVNSEFMLYASGLLFGVSMGFSFPLLNAMAVKNTPAERWGAANAMFFIANDLGVGLGALIWGIVVDTWGFAPIFIGGSITFAIAYIVGFIIFPRRSLL